MDVPSLTFSSKCAINRTSDVICPIHMLQIVLVIFALFAIGFVIDLQSRNNSQNLQRVNKFSMRRKSVKCVYLPIHPSLIKSIHKINKARKFLRPKTWLNYKIYYSSRKKRVKTNGIYFCAYAAAIDFWLIKEGYIVHKIQDTQTDW